MPIFRETVTIRTEPHSVMQAINRQIAHYSYHIGQIVFLAKHFAAANWNCDDGASREIHAIHGCGERRPGVAALKSAALELLLLRRQIFLVDTGHHHVIRVHHFRQVNFAHL